MSTVATITAEPTEAVEQSVKTTIDTQLPFTDKNNEPYYIDKNIHPNIDHIITEDDEAVDNMFSAKQQRLLIEPLYSSWSVERIFLADSNVGVFRSIKHPPTVPDVFLSMDVKPSENWWEKRHRSYFIWEFGKAPDVVIEIVSNKKGGEADKKLRDYADMGSLHYIIFDPQKQIQNQVLNVYELHVGEYVLKDNAQIERLGLGLTLWEGTWEDRHDTWLRWCLMDGTIIPTGAERAEKEHQRAEKERQRAEKLTAQLRALGIEPDI